MNDLVQTPGDAKSEAPTYPGARDPDRIRSVASDGLRINVSEWGDPVAPAILACHGMWDSARSFAVLGPLVADSGYRVVAIDLRGHGDSDWAQAYAWFGWVRDLVRVADTLPDRFYLLGHSMGGGLSNDLARFLAKRVVKLVNIDGFGPGPEHQVPPVPERFAHFLDYRRRMAARRDWRPYASLDDLVARRRAQNPRLSAAWLRYFLFHGSRCSADGWRWKADPQMVADMGPWTPEWITPGWTKLTVPMLAIVGSEKDTWGPLPEDLLSERLSHVPTLRRETIMGAGHFVHIEQPRATADVVVDYLSQ